MASEMENREWLNEYAAVKQVSESNPFTVPASYFEELSERIMSGVRLAELKTNIPSDGFAVPENYFDTLTGNIQSRINIENAVGAEDGFGVPTGYFDDLANQISSRIFIDDALNVDTGFTVPQNYFEDLSNTIQSRIFVKEALNADAGFAVPENYFEDLSSKINSRIFVEEALAATADSFEVPQNYFNTLNQNIVSKTIRQEKIRRNETKVVSIWSGNFLKYATAACLLLMVGAGIFVQRANDPETVHKNSYLHKTLSKIPLDDLQNYLETDVDDPQHEATNEGLTIDTQSLDEALQADLKGGE
jgi:hypothetical protein